MFRWDEGTDDTVLHASLVNPVAPAARWSPAATVPVSISTLGLFPEAHSFVMAVVVLKDEPSAAWPSEPTTPDNNRGADRPATALTLSIGEMRMRPALSELISVAAYPPSE